MSAPITATITNPAVATVGFGSIWTVIKSGGTPWTYSTMASVLTASSAALAAPQVNFTIDNQSTTNDGTDSTCTFVAYNGDAAGTNNVTITDTIDGGTATLSISGTLSFHSNANGTLYVAGGLPNILPAPQITLGGTLASAVESCGSTVYAIAVIPHYSSGHAKGYPFAPNAIPASNPPGNMPSVAMETFKASTAATTSIPVDPRLAVVMCGPDSGSGTSGWSASNCITVSWATPTTSTLLTGYDIAIANISAAQTTWSQAASNTSGTSFVINSAPSGTPYTMQAANTTAIGSDSNNGLTPATALATLHGAAAIATTGQLVMVLTGTAQTVVTETSQVVFAAGVNLTSNGDASSVTCESFYKPTTGTQHASYLSGGFATWSNLTFKTNENGTRVLGVGTADAILTDFILQNGRSYGFTNNILLDFGFSDITIVDWIDESAHGGFGQLGVGSLVNLLRFRTISRGSPPIANTITELSYQQTQGYLYGRDCTFITSRDTQVEQQCIAVGITSNGSLQRGMRLTNCVLYGVDIDVQATSAVGLTNVIMDNTPIDTVKNASIAAVMTTINDSPPTYHPDPLQVPLPANVAKGTVYGGGSLTGTMASPSMISGVAIGARGGISI